MQKFVSALLLKRQIEYFHSINWTEFLNFLSINIRNISEHTTNLHYFQVAVIPFTFWETLFSAATFA